MKNLNVIVAFAADHLDREANKATVEDRVDDLSKLNQRVHSGDELFKLWAEAKGGRAIAMGKGDGIIEIGADHLEELSQLKEQYNQEVGSTCSVGVGVKLSEAEKALTYAQRTGGNSIELFTEELEQELASLHEPEGEEKLFNAFFDKAEAPVDKTANSLNPTTVKNAGGGMTGAHEPTQAGPDAPDEPQAGGAPEMSENAALQNALESQPQAPDALGQFAQLAEQSEQKEGQEKQAQADEAQDDEDQKNLRGAVVEVLKQFKEQGPLWEQLKQAQPDAYKTLTGVIQAMVALARKAFMEEGEEGEGQEQQPQQEQPVQKAELPLAPAMHTTVESFLGAMKAMPKEGPARGKFITSHMHHAPFLQALQAHPQGKQVHTMLTSFMSSKANAGVGVGAKVVAKAALEAGKTGRHQVVLPVGSQLDGSASADKEKVGRVKILDRNSGKTKWRQTRAGIVSDPMGNPTSSRNPTGGVKPEDVVH